MTDPATFFADKLWESAENFVWAILQSPVKRRFAVPPKPLGEWSVARQVFHMLHYERALALPSMRQWLGEPLPPRDIWAQEATIWNDGRDHDFDDLVASFLAVRAEEIALLSQFPSVAWEEPRVAIWGPATTTLYWTVCKTYQHTFEHTNTVLQMTLFWDRIMERIQARS